ncbi:PREDICTED: ubiquitin carboxyl-terminal hydrolase 8-like [Prunus mume]|uniref:Ubiquitin carboxyl-terminal hydrolase 8-like n=1 Tax=Prunus mume TaxID=102107 RepID=A0ABM0NYK2_PRUMU|nr:PREDICTED: ubiquitin carboxyl-terminal hydrolase 8-like [Prunus mume]
MEAVALSEDLSDSTQRSDSDSNRQIYFIPYSWWRDAQDSVLGDSDGKRGILYVTSQASSYAGPMKIINNIFNSDLVFNLKREEDTVHSGENGEVGVSGRDYALVPTEMWVQALRW